MTVWICDVNGVLVDTGTLVRDAFAAAALHGGFRCTDTDFNRIKGLPLVEAYRWLHPRSEPERWRQFHIRFVRERLDRVSAYPDVLAVLTIARSAGVRLAATTSHGQIAEACLVRTGLYSSIECLVTQEEVKRPKPHPESILRTLALMGMDPARLEGKQVVYVGDTAEDIAAGRAAGVRTVGVTYGISDEEEIRAARPDHVIHGFAAMRTFVDRVAGVGMAHA